MSESHFLVSLFHKHQLELRNFVALKFKKPSHEAEDIVQDAFHNILRIENFESVENPKAYLYQTANNLALNRLRKQQRHHLYMAEQEVMEADRVNELNPERTLIAARDLKRVENALVKLPQKYRRTFILSRVHDKTYKEISELLGISESTVEKHIIKTLKYLRDQLAKDLTL